MLKGNARLGLATQTANRCGLLHRLAWGDDHTAELTDIDRRLEAAARLAGIG